MHEKQFAIETRALSKSFGDVMAVNSLDLAVPRHSIFGFLGPNGAGKTTTMKMLLGLTRPTRGSGTILGHDIVRDGLAIRARIGYLPQQPHFIDTMTARETLRFTARFFYERSAPGIETRIDQTLTLVGLTDKADRPVKGFSGGERQRLGLALAQINDPEVLILDEPAAALDPIGRHDVLMVMERLREHATIFYSTHILDDVQQVSDTVAILNHGDLITQGPISQLLAGDDTTIFSVTLEGALDGLQKRISSLPWVTDIHTMHQNGTTTWQIAVSDALEARKHLLRRILDSEQITVNSFEQKSYELEEVFMQIVGASS